VARAHVADDLVYGAALAPEKALAAAACADGAVHVFALPALTRTATPWRHEGPAVAVAFAPGGALLASAGRDGKILLGDPVADARPLALLDHTAAVTCLAWSTDGERLASGAVDGKVRLHERTGRLLRTWARLGGAVTAVELRADRIVASIEGAPGSVPRAVELDVTQPR
jgi:WD40 repeat protein